MNLFYQLDHVVREDYDLSDPMSLTIIVFECDELRGRIAGVVSSVEREEYQYLI